MVKHKAKTTPDSARPPRADRRSGAKLMGGADAAKTQPSPATSKRGKVLKPHFGGRTQFAALPYRPGETGLEILLITSRETQRWVIPKGWPMKGRSQWGAAAQEALEEAGVKGKIGRKPIGSFDYVKRGRGGQQWPCEVKVFPLEVLDQRAGWKERSERERVWFGVDDAAAAVDEPALRLLILSFALRRSTGAA